MKSNPCTVEGCEQPIWSNKLCKRHKALAALKEPSERDKKYKELRFGYLNAHPVCEVDGCNRTDVDLHHKKGRIGDNLFKHFMSVCREHHIYIETHPSWAYEQGYLLKRNFKENDK